MSGDLIEGAETVSLFCRLHINTRKDMPIRSSEMGLLILICKSEKLVTPVIAADFFKVKKPMITTMVSSLIQHGYIEKVPSPRDKRSFILNPSKNARKLVDVTFKEYIKTMKLLQEQLGPNNFSNLIVLLKKANTVLLEEKNHE